MESKLIDINEKIGLIEIYEDLDAENATLLFHKTEGLFNLGVTDIILNLIETNFMSHIAVAVIARTSKTCYRRKGQLSILYKNHLVFDLLAITNLEQYINFYHSMEEAREKISQNHRLQYDN